LREYEEEMKNMIWFFEFMEKKAKRKRKKAKKNKNQP
jgi:hypothetical protein